MQVQTFYITDSQFFIDEGQLDTADMRNPTGKKGEHQNRDLSTEFCNEQVIFNINICI